MIKQALIAANISEGFKSHLLNKGYKLVPYQETASDTTEITGIVTSTKLHLDKKTIDQYPKLQWIARLGSGVEIIDLDYCNEKGIVVASSPVGIANAVAEHCIALIISLQKNIHSSFLEIKNNQWIREANRGTELDGKTIGIIGYGHTGMAFAQKLSVFGCTVLAYDKYKTTFSDNYVQETELITLQEKADIISFHIPYNQETHHYYNKDFIEKCKPHIIINTSRGAVVNTENLIEGLQNKKITGAALDVIENEHLLVDSNHEQWNVVHKLLEYNVIITPHIAGYSRNAIEKMSAELIAKLEQKKSFKSFPIS